MHKLLALFWFLCTLTAIGQPPALQLTQRGFEPVTTNIPAVSSEKFIALSKAWVNELDRSGQHFDISFVSSTSLTVSGIKRNAFFYRDRGETYTHKAKLVMKIDFTETSYTLTLTVPEIYAESDVLLKYTLPNYFNSDGNIKEGYDGLKRSLEETVNTVAENYYNFIINYK